MSATSIPVGPGSRVVIVDISSFLHRAYHQSRNQDPKYNYRPSDGMPTGAIRLLFNKILQFSRDGFAGVTPTHLLYVFDMATKQSVRKAIYPEYKANRSAPDEDLRRQMPLTRDLIRAFGIEPVEIDRYEADDLIAAYTKEAVSRGAEVLVVSPDKDLMQLAGPGVRCLDVETGIPGKPGYRPERLLDRDGVTERWKGVPPEKIADVLALMGDTSDNVPGVDGIGEITAAQLINEYGSLEGLLSRLDEIRQPARRQKLVDQADRARLSYRLVTLDDGIPLPEPIDAFAATAPDPARLIAFLKPLELNAQVKRVAKDFKIDASSVAADGALSADAGNLHPLAAVAWNGKPAIVSEPEGLKTLIALLREAGRFSVLLEDGPDGPVGIAFSTQPGTSHYLPLGHQEGEQTLFGGGRAAGQMPPEAALALLKPVFESPEIVKIAHDAKSLLIALAARGVALAGFEDAMLASYALDSGRASHDLASLSQSRLLAHELRDADSVTGSGRGRISFENAQIPAAAAYLGERADALLRIWTILEERLASEATGSVYRDLEVPMVPILARMQGRGIRVDRPILARLSHEFGARMAELEAEAHKLAGMPFQISSPKQIGEVFFDRLGLPGGKKTASGQWATPANILEQLTDAGHALPRVILDWRTLAKLKSTYTDALQVVADPRTDRLHTHYQLAATTTGRLSSTEPNLQNIPIRSEMGRRIRAAFVASPGHVIVSADYSQVELRLLAHMADLPQLRAAFEAGIDIHAATASEMFGVPLEQMTPELRRNAKTINFGIIYGISAFGLSQRLGIPQGEAASFINRYFDRFPGIRAYIEDTKAALRRDGHVKTLFGRVCHFNIEGAKGPEAASIERAAINAPIQGTAADILRRAMMRMEGALDRSSLGARMLLQVHDELVFEVPEDEVGPTLALVREVMEGAAAPAINLSVKLLVEAAAAPNWDEAH